MKYISNYKQMRLILIYDLPMQEDLDRKIYEKFHKKLTTLGFNMLQYSVYSKVIRNDDGYKQIKQKTEEIIPKKGKIIIFKITENQYQNMIYLRGEQNKFDVLVGNKELVVFKGESSD